MCIDITIGCKPCLFCKTTKTPERIGKIPVCGNCLAEIYEKGKKGSDRGTGSEGSELEKLILNYMFDNCPACGMDKQKLAKELAWKIAGLLAEHCPEGGCHAGVA